MDFNDYTRQGSAFWQEGEYGKAIESYEAALKLQPNNTDLQQAIEGMKMNAVQLAELHRKFAEACIGEARSMADFMGSYYGVRLEEITGVDKIIAEYTQNPSCRPYSFIGLGTERRDSTFGILSLAYYIQGLIFESKRDHAQAVKAYSEAINYEPNYPSAFNKRGRANLNIGKIENCDQAIEDFKKANLDEAQLKQQLAGAYWKRATVYYEKGEYGKVVEDCERVLELSPTDGNASELLNMAKAQK